MAGGTEELAMTTNKYPATTLAVEVEETTATGSLPNQQQLQAGFRGSTLKCILSHRDPATVQLEEPILQERQ